MASKRKQDEKHLKMLREMVALPHNKQCFDCHQRGPTYVNMTIGAYVCTACSGILRGINPPHRVKSISMASFTSEEIDFIKCHGNDFCRKVWLGLFDSRTSSEPDSKDEQKVKDFMAQKYERKRWYVAPTDAMKEEAKQLNEVATNKQPTTKPLKSLLGENAPKLVVQNNQQTPKNPPPVQAPTSVSSAAPQKSFPSPGTQSQSSQSSGSVTMDLLGDLGGDPFASATPAPVSQPTVSSGGEGGFADFANFNQFSAQTPTQSFPAFQSASNPLVPLGGSTTSTSTPAPIPDGGFGGMTAPPVTSTASSGDKYSALTDLFSDSVPASTQSSSVNWSGGGGTTGSTSGINWSGGSSGSTGISWGGTSSTPSSGGIDWNSSGNTTSDNSGLNWNNTGTTNTSNGGVGWSTSTNSSAGFPATVFPPNTNMYPSGKPGNPFFSDSGGSVSNPFGGVSTSVPSQAVGGGITNPFGGASQNMFGGTGGFGQPTQGMGQQQIGGMGQQQLAGIGQPAPNAAGFGHPGGFGQSAFGQTGFGGTPGTMGAGFGGAPGVGGVPQSGAQFGQFGMQNGGTGFNQASSSSAGAFQQTMPTSVGGAMNLSSGQFDNKLGGTQSTQGFPAGWGQTSQQPVANPFMSAASQPMASKTGSTNPFL